MSLELLLSLDRESCLQGESIGLELTLRNGGDEPKEIPSLEGNDQIVAFLLLDESGKELGTYDGRDVQRILGTSRLRENRFELTTFESGGSEQVYRDLLRYRAALPPGRYEIVALYRWEDISLRAEPRALEVVPSRPGIIAVGWDNDIGGPHHLLYAWSDHDGERWLLMDASTFGATHRGLFHASRASEVGRVNQLQVSRDLGDVADMQGTLVWKESDRLKWRAIEGGEEFPVHQASVDLPDWSLVSAPHRENATTTLVLLENEDGTEVMTLGLLDDGQTSEIDRRNTPATKGRFFVHSMDGGPRMIQLRDTPREGSVVEAVGLARSGETVTIEEFERPADHLTAVIGETGHAIAAAAILPEEGNVFLTRIWRAPDWRAEAGPEFAVPDDHRLELRIGPSGTLHALARGPKGGLFYSNDGDAFDPVHSDSMDLERSMLVVGRNAIGFLLGPGKDGGVWLEALDEPELSGVRGPSTSGDEEDEED